MDIEKKFPKTFEALMSAFAGESQARNKYDFFAKVARKEGNQKLADLFEETARNEHEHAKLLFKTALGIGTTKENLQAAIDGEHYENQTMYPDFEKIAKEENFTEAQLLFNNLAQVEKEHEKRFKELLEKVNNKELYSSKTEVEWKCKKCGHIHNANEAPQRCPVCNHPQGYFEKNCKI